MAAAVAVLAAILACGFIRRSPTIRSVTAVELADGHVVVTTAESQSRRGQHERRWTVDDIGYDLGYDLGQSSTPALTQQCVLSVCYRVAPGRLAVEQSTDLGITWAPAWHLPDDVYADLVTSLHTPGLASLSLVVRAVPAGHEVFVANGRDGLLYRGPDGRWSRVGFPAGGEGIYYEPAPRLSSDPIAWGPRVAATLPVLGALVAFAVRGRRDRRRGRLGAVVAVTVAGAMAAYGGARFPDVGMFPGVFYGFPIILGAILATTLVAAGIPARRPASPPA